MKKAAAYLSLILIFFAAMFFHADAANSGKPDFAFPQKVEKEARQQLAEAMRKSDGRAAVRALINFGLAKSIVNTDSIPSVLAEVKQVTLAEKNPATRAMLNALSATIYRQLYSADSYTYDTRPASDIAGENYTLWCREDFLQRVDSLVEASLADAAALKTSPITAFGNVVDSSTVNKIFYPTLYDFIVAQGIDNLEEFASYNSGMRVLSPKLMTNPSDRNLFPGATCAPLARILQLYGDLIAFHADNSAPRFYQEVNVRKFVRQHLFETNEVEEEDFTEDEYAGPQQKFSESDSYAAYRAEMLRLYQANESDVYSGLFLAEYATGIPVDYAAPAYDMLLKFRERFPAFYDKNRIDNIIADFSRVNVSASFPRTAMPGEEVTARIASTNSKSVTLKVFDVSRVVSANDNMSGVRIPAYAKSVVEKTIRFDKNVPFGASDTITFRLPAYGYYACLLEAEGAETDRGYCTVISCTSLSTGRVKIGDTDQAIVVNPTTGAPVKGASIYFAPWSRRSGFQPVGKPTDADGVSALRLKESGRLSAIKGVDRYSFPFYASPSFSMMEADSTITASLFTALKLYRPGDEVEFALFTFTNHPDSRTVAPGKRCSVTLFDANYQPVDTVVVVTDSWGRARGSFNLPVEGLTGTFTLEAATMSKDARHIGSANFTVSDYKLPTFELDEAKVNRPATVNDPAVITGRAVMYSGFPVADARVKVSLKVRSGFWWWAQTSAEFFRTETTTSTDGNFTIEIPASAIAASPAPDGLFLADIEVTSPDGETQTTTARFSLGKPLEISLTVPQNINLDQPFSALVDLVDVNGDAQSAPLRYILYKVKAAEKCSALARGGNAPAKDDAKEVASGELQPGSIAALLGKQAPGAYRLKVLTADASLADSATSNIFYLYKPNSSVCPVDKPLWVPQTSVTANAEGVAELPVGSALADTWMRMTVSVYPGKVVEQRWIRPRKGVHTVKILLPQGALSADVMLNTVYGSEHYSASATVLASISDKAIDLKITTFRDKVTPGSTEKVTLRVSPKGDTPAQSALVLDMTNAAIDALAANPLSISPFRPAGWMTDTDGWLFPDGREYVNGGYKRLDEAVVTAPEFEFYGYQFGKNNKFLSRNMFIRGSHKMAATGAVLEESVMLMDAVAPEAAEMKAEATEVGSGAEDEASSDSDAGAPVEEKKESYRPSEIPLAFFRPMLTTAEDGSLEISYEVPDANTTWILRALAYNSNTLVANASANIVASKPVMVSLNAPRFLRVADRALLAASVMNNTDSLQRVAVKAQVLSSVDNSVVATTDTIFEMDARTAQVVRLEVEAPAGVPGLIYRVMATAGDFADGEQSLMPVLPSEQDVTESKMFYIAPNASGFEMELPAIGKDDRAYLNFTENPAWEVVSALPGLRENKINSSLEGAAALFSACVAEGLIRDNAELSRVLRRWLDNPTDSALVSNFEKNKELKSMLLASTPWVSEALSDTQRMQRLALLFDKRQCERAKQEAMALLAKTRVSGGWSWTDKYPDVSEFCTEAVLEQLGDLRRMGWLPADKRLSQWIKESCEYLDREAVKRFKKYPDSDFLLYVLLRDAFPEVKYSTAASRVVEAQVQRCLAQWKKVPVVYRAAYATVLNNHGYNATARRLLASLREMATSTPEKGMWWQQLDRSTFGPYDRIGCTAIILDAFHNVEPRCADIDKIRQFLILNKTNNDWGNGVITSQVITSILTSGAPLKVNTRATAIRVGDTLLQPTSPEYATGAFTEQITSLLAKPEKLVIDRQADYPSVGGVLTMRRLPMDSIKAVGCEEISVEKSLSVFDGTQWVASDSFKVGDRVRVELVLKVEDDLSYVVIEDLRASGLEPAEQLPAPIWSEGLCFYRENRDSQTNIFIDFLPRGTYRLAYELFASGAGTFASGVARTQSAYNPIVAAHSAGTILTIR